MADNALSRKQRLRTLEKEIREGMEEFYYTGMKLKEIRDDELYKEDGFGTWEAYCRKRWEWSANYTYKLISAAEYREKLPDVDESYTSGQKGWSEFSVRELTRIPDKRQAARVAEKIVREVEKSQKAAEEDPDVKPLTLSAATVRKFVDQDLGIDRTAKAQETKAAREASVPTLVEIVDRHVGTIAGMKEALQAIPDDLWKDDRLRAKIQRSVKRLTAEVSALAEFLEGLYP